MELQEHLIESAWDYLAIQKALADDDSGFRHNQATFLQAYKEQRLWGLVVKETDNMYMNDAYKDEIYLKGNTTLYLLPAVCVLDNEYSKIHILWVHTKLRGKGIGSRFVSILEGGLDELEPQDVLTEAIPFWDSIKAYKGLWAMFSDDS